MTDTDTAAIEARLAAATPGPWVRIGQYVAAPTIGCNCAAPPEYGHEPYCGAEPVAQAGEVDGDLIANAPTDLRALLDEVERLRTERGEALREAAGWVAEAIGYPIQAVMPDHPMPDALWTALVDHVYADLTVGWHGGELTREEVDAWLREEANRPTCTMHEETEEERG